VSAHTSEPQHWSAEPHAPPWPAQGKQTFPLSSERGVHLAAVQSASVAQSWRHTSSVALVPMHDMPWQQYAMPGPHA
jgi:hypothetical protein